MHHTYEIHGITPACIIIRRRCSTTRQEPFANTTTIIEHKPPTQTPTHDHFCTQGAQTPFRHQLVHIFDGQLPGEALYVDGSRVRVVCREAGQRIWHSNTPLSARARLIRHTRAHARGKTKPELEQPESTARSRWYADDSPMRETAKPSARILRIWLNFALSRMVSIFPAHISQVMANPLLPDWVGQHSAQRQAKSDTVRARFCGYVLVRACHSASSCVIIRVEVQHRSSCCEAS